MRLMPGRLSPLVWGLAQPLLLLPEGLTMAAVGWAIAQGTSLLIGLVLIAAGRAGRHRLAVSRG